MENPIKRPINLLCLSDLHLDSPSGQEVLRKLRLAVKQLQEEDIRWMPDFIVLAGDLVDARHKEYYPKVQEYLASFTEDKDFQLDPFRIIAVPGNHDRSIHCWADACYRRSSRYAGCRELKKNAQLKAAIQKDAFNFDLGGEYNSNFQSFADFYKPYVEKQKEGEEYLFAKEYLGEKLSNVALTSGLKVFHYAKTCFLCINTEWVYFPDEDRAYDGGFLCSPVVFSSLKEYFDHYKDYTLVTVMHRHPSELSWETKFRAMPYKPDLLRYLFQYSDLILTGHNHTERLLPPDRMENHAQLFQLGPAAMTSRDSTLPQYHASLIHVEPISGRVKICNFRYEHGKRDWDFDIDRNDYPIAPFAAMLHSDMRPSLAESVVIHLPSHREEDIEKALRRHFPDMEDYALSWKNIHDSHLVDWIKEKYPKRKTAFFIYSLTNHDRDKFRDLKGRLFSDKDFREAVYRKDCLLLEVWFKHRDTGLPPSYPLKSIL